MQNFLLKIFCKNIILHQVVRPGNENEFEFTNLDPDTEYRVEVVGVITSANRTYESPAGNANGRTGNIV